MPKRTKPKNPPSLHVIASVNEGILEILHKPRGVAVTVFDYDIEGSGDHESGRGKDPDGQPCFFSQWPASATIIGDRRWPIVQQAARDTRRLYSRKWACPTCKRTAWLSYEELAAAGTPICTDCDTEMEVQ